MYQTRLAWFVVSVVTLVSPIFADVAPWETASLQPSWAGVRAQRVISLQPSNGDTDQVNGLALMRAVERLRPGDRLEIAPGRYSVAAKWSVNLRGTKQAPIWIVAKSKDEPPTITRPDALQNVMTVGERSTTQYVCFRHLELTGGSTLIRFYDCHHLWLDQCHLHHSGAEGVTANSRDTSHLFITSNHFHDFVHPNATGEAMYLGANHGKAVMSYSVIANNHVHDCRGTQGDGIEVKQGSHHNWIIGNHVHDTNYPCIIAYGTSGNGINLIERNVCYRSNDNVMQMQGEAIVRNNLVMAPRGTGFASTDHQGKSRGLSLIHNTILAKGRAVNLISWNGRDGMFLVNNVLYSDGGDAVRFPRGSADVTISGNLVTGRVVGAVSEGFAKGNGLSDFVDADWNGTRRSAALRADSPFVGQADPEHATSTDIDGQKRNQNPTAGAFVPRKGI
ncbi:MAG: right-handed parallel beta-helix repeat-containing protein [Planctomycetota bacterium]